MTAQATSLADALAVRRSGREYDAAPVPLALVEALLKTADGPTGADGSGRTAPSAHAVHPLRFVLVAGRVGGLAPGAYDVEAGSLIRPVWPHGPDLDRLADAAIGDQPWVRNAAFVVAILGDESGMVEEFRDQTPDGGRGLRYLWMEAGAVAQSLSLHAAATGLAGVLVAGIDDGLALEAFGRRDRVPLAFMAFGLPLRPA